MFKKLDKMLERYDKLNELVSDSQVIARMDEWKAYTKELAEITENKDIELALGRLEAKELRAKHRNQSKSSDCRHDHDDTCDPSELLEHHTCHTLDHSKRHENGKHGQGRGDNRNTHFLCSMNSGLLRLGTSFKMCRDILKYHDGVVHNHTDCDRKC